MARMTKPQNANYLQSVQAKQFATNEQNRGYIDRFVKENYERLRAKFAATGNAINSSAFGALDKLNETIYSLYTDSALCFTSWGEAERYMLNKFTEKDIRIQMAKPVRGDSGEDVESENEFINN